MQRNGIQGDARKLFTVRTVNGQPVIQKYIYDYEPANPLNTNGKWWLMRAAQVHLHLAEAANHDNKRKLALALLNNGISPYYNNPNQPDIRLNFDTFYEFPYNFSARSSNAPYNFRDLYHQHAGILWPPDHSFKAGLKAWTFEPAYSFMAMPAGQGRTALRLKGPNFKSDQGLVCAKRT